MAVKKIIGRVEFKENLAGNNFLLRIGFGERLHYLPGQYASLKVSSDGIRRSYSVASLPGENYIDILVDVSPMGVGSKYMLGLRVGDEVEVMGFLGRFVVSPQVLQASKSLMFVATGTGVAPFKPMIEDVLYNKKYRGEVRLVWGMRHEKDLYWLKELSNINRDFDNFRYDIVLSQPTVDWPGFKGHVNNVFNTLEQDWVTMAVFLCGSPEMITQSEKEFIENGVLPESIFYEKYY